jgi:hypothetical protein
MTFIGLDSDGQNCDCCEAAESTSRAFACNQFGEIEPFGQPIGVILKFGCHRKHRTDRDFGFSRGSAKIF